MEPEQQFHFRDGTSIASLDGLKEKIETISYDEFYNHVDNSKNDFANWVRYVLKDSTLADNLEKVDSIVETVELLEDYMNPRPKRDDEDIQDRIEEAIGFEEPQESDEQLEAPPSLGERADDLRAPPEESEPEAQAQEDPEELEFEAQEEELTPKQQPTQEQQDDDDEDDEEPESEASRHFRRLKAERDEIDSFHHQLHRVIVKDFIWGMFFGLALGFILARMLML